MPAAPKGAAGIRLLRPVAYDYNRRARFSGAVSGIESEQTQATDERLNLLINIVERHISEVRNGKP